MKVLIVIEHLYIGGGAERVAVEVAEGLQEKGNEVILLTFKSEKENYDYNGKIISLNEKSKYVTKLYKMVKRARKIKKICKKEKIDTVISFLHTANLSVALSKSLFKNKSKTIVSERNNTMEKPFIMRWLIKKLYPKADLVVAVSKNIEIILNKNFNIKNTKTIYNFKNIEKIIKESKKSIVKEHNVLFNKKFTFITAGRLCKQKAHWNLVRAFKKVSDEHESAKLIIRGTGQLENKLQKLIDELNLKNKVFLLGKVDNIFSYYKKADCFILSSKYEGMPNVILEALVLNKPVISTDCISGPREILCPELEIEEKISYPYYGTYGVLVEPMLDGNDFCDLTEKPLTPQEETLADVMINFIKDEKSRKRYVNGLERAKDFDKNKIIEKWDEII